MRWRKSKRRERDMELREASRPDERTLRVLARLEGTATRYERLVDYLDRQYGEHGDSDSRHRREGHA